VAGLLAIDEAGYDRIPRVSISHFEFARHLGMRWVDSTLGLIEKLGRTRFERNCDSVLSIVWAHPNGMRFRDLYRKLRQLKPRDVGDLLSALQLQGEITVAKDSSKKGPEFDLIFPAPGGLA